MAQEITMDARTAERAEMALSRVKACAAALNIFEIYDEEVGGEHVYQVDFLKMLADELHNAVQTIEGCMAAEA